MFRSRSLTIAAQLLLIVSLALCSAAAFAQSAASWSPEGQDWTAIQTDGSTAFAPCPTFACNCNQQTQANCTGACIAATVTGCGPGGGFPCNGCR